MINPASIQSVRNKYPNYQPGMGDQFAMLANSYLQGAQAKKTQEQNQLSGAFPTLAANKMVRPGGQPGQPGTVQFGGSPWTMQQPGQDWGDVNSMLLAKDRMGLIPPSDYDLLGKAQQNILNSGTAIQYFQSKNPQERARMLMDEVAAMKEAMKIGPTSSTQTTRLKKATKAKAGAPLQGTYQGQPVFLAEDGKYYFEGEF